MKTFIKQHGVKLIFVIAGFVYMTGMEVYCVNLKRQSQLNGTWSSGCIYSHVLPSVYEVETSTFKDGKELAEVKVYNDKQCKKDELEEIKEEWNIYFTSDNDMQLTFIKHAQAFTWDFEVEVANTMDTYHHHDWKLGEFKDVSDAVIGQLSKVGTLHVDFKPNGYVIRNINFTRIKQ